MNNTHLHICQVIKCRVYLHIYLNGSLHGTYVYCSNYAYLVKANVAINIEQEVHHATGNANL